jgi:prevent-host-death family protein
MAQVPTRELRNHTAGLLRRVEAGEHIVVTVRGRPVAELVPVTTSRRQWMPRAELLEILRRTQADSQLRYDLAEIAGDITDDLGPIR